ncbi:DUF350 domain-containing protein [Paenibacillus radicibacter]|uniref:DUF350 domain-containing protein n=1 Tax=Paenibacillus radicibacter TaxID=2972488 RepID=UPI00358FEAF6
MSFWTENRYLSTIGFFSVTVILLVVFLTIFEIVTKYNDWEEIKKGNVSVAMATGGKVFGICNIIRYAIQNHDTFGQSIVWSVFGFVLLMVSYFIFEFLTPNIKVDQEIQRDNRAVGFLSMILSVSISFVIGACVS